MCKDTNFSNKRNTIISNFKTDCINLRISFFIHSPTLTIEKHRKAFRLNISLSTTHRVKALNN